MLMSIQCEPSERTCNKIQNPAQAAATGHAITTKMKSQQIANK